MDDAIALARRSAYVDLDTVEMHTTRATLFPVLEGLAHSLTYELEFHGGYDPRREGRD